MLTIWLGMCLFSHLRNSFFFPRSYMRSTLPIPASRRPWNAHSAPGASSISVRWTCSSSFVWLSTRYTSMKPPLPIFGLICRSFATPATTYHF
uniref:Putative secreted protein n=1 Tax=Anopheles darlingi TaxID=43151 RepID=A0A2M4D3A9_ANODA